MQKIADKDKFCTTKIEGTKRLFFPNDGKIRYCVMNCPFKLLTYPLICSTSLLVEGATRMGYNSDARSILGVIKVLPRRCKQGNNGKQHCDGHQNHEE